VHKIYNHENYQEISH